MGKIFKTSRCLPLRPKSLNNLQENVNRILHITITYNQLLNTFICPIPISWKQSSETYRISRNLKMFLVIPIFKFTHVIFLTSIAIHGPFYAANKLPESSSAIFAINIISLMATAFGDIFVFYFATDIVNCFGWAYQIARDFLRLWKFRKSNLFINHFCIC